MANIANGKNLLLYEPVTPLHNILQAALAGAGFNVTSVTKMPTVLPADSWLVTGGEDPIALTALLRERLGEQAGIFHLLPTGESNGTLYGIQKPFRLQDMIVQLTRIMNRPRDVNIGVHKLHVNIRQLEFEGGRIVPLTEKEVAILLHLALTGAPVPRDALLHEVWGYHPEATTHTLETHIYRLRQKVEKDPENPSFLTTTEAGYALA